MQHFLGLYGKVYPKLIKNDPRYPRPEDLLSKVRVGNIEFEGDMRAPTPITAFPLRILIRIRPLPNIHRFVWSHSAITG